MQSNKTRTIVKCGMLSAIATALMLFEFPLPFIAPTFYELDFSEVPVLLGAFSMGPLAGVIIEGIKVLLNLLINGTVTAGIGELANFIMGALFVFPAGLIYKYSKTKKGAMLGLSVGGISLIIMGCLINVYVMLPAYGAAFGMPIEAFISMATDIFPFIDNMFEFVLFCVAPFNLIKATLVSIITLIVYKRLSPILHR
ncbi:MAG: ECF transporter S component [Eubacteriales bacterium]|nr:ECF transporter S component [Eubacteriales bacterium]